VDDVFLTCFALIAGWAVLRVIGGERERRVRDLQITIAAGDAPAAKPRG
jgi:hypothetical protein